MNIISKIDHIIVSPFQKIVYSLENRGIDPSSCLIKMTVMSFIMFIVAEVLQTYSNFCLGYSNFGYTKYVGIKSLEIRDLLWNILPFLIAIIIAFTIRDCKKAKNGEWDEFFLNLMTKGKFVGLQARVFYVCIFLLTISDIIELESLGTLWKIINRDIASYHYFLGISSVLSILFCLLSFFILTVSIFFIGCNYNEK